MKLKGRDMIVALYAVPFWVVKQQVVSRRAWKRGAPPHFLPYTVSCLYICLYNVYISNRKMLTMKWKIPGMLVAQRVLLFVVVGQQVASLGVWKGGSTPSYNPKQQHMLCYNHAWYFPFHCEHFSVIIITVEARNRIGVEN